MKLAIAAAGTGGHIIPALNIARYLQDQPNSDHHIHWIGTPQGMENQLVRLPIPMHAIVFSGVRKKGIARWLSLPFSLLRATLQAKNILQLIQPDAVLVMGGYVSVPTALAAWQLKLPLIIHEQNAIAGLANKFCCLFASKVCYAFKGAFSNPSNKFIHTGNPISATLQHPSLKKQSSHFHVLVLGGSLGAKSINQTVPSALAHLQQTIEQPLSITHQCGHQHKMDTKAQYQRYALSVKVIEFSPSLEDLYQQADMIIARAGAMSVAEISALGCPALFIPYPYAVGDHQYHNALSLQQSNPQHTHTNQRYQILRDHQLNTEILAKTLYQLYQEAQSQPTTPTHSIHTQATEKIIHVIEQSLTQLS